MQNGSTVVCRGCRKGMDTFVHYSAIDGKGYRKLAEGDVVEMSVEKGEKEMLQLLLNVGIVAVWMEAGLFDTGETQ